MHGDEARQRRRVQRVVGVAVAVASATILAACSSGTSTSASRSTRATGGGGSSTTLAPTTTASSAATTTAPVTTAAPSTTAVDVSGLPAGLLCKDLAARGLGYAAAVAYWRAHGQPANMDADKNGIPCETVYPAADVAAVWGPTPTTAKTGSPPCTAAAVRAAIQAANPGATFSGTPKCSGAWAAVSPTDPEGDDYAELLHWNGTAWEPANCNKYRDSTDGSSSDFSTSKVVPQEVFYWGCDVS